MLCSVSTEINLTIFASEDFLTSSYNLDLWQQPSIILYLLLSVITTAYMAPTWHPFTAASQFFVTRPSTVMDQFPALIYTLLECKIVGLINLGGVVSCFFQHIWAPNFI